MVNKNSATYQLFRKIGYIGGIAIRYIATAIILGILRKKLKWPHRIAPSPVIEGSLKTNN
jgi:hypothetical protein